MSDETDQELWELLNEKPPQEESQKSGSNNYAKNKARRKAKKKQQTMTIIIAVMAVVIIGLAGLLAVGTYKSSDAGLQSQIQKLKEENEALLSDYLKLTDENLEKEQKIEDLNSLLDQISSDVENVESGAAAQMGQISGKLQAYEDLIKALNAMLTYDEETLNEALEDLEENIDYLSSDALNAYYMVLEYMEQPYWGLQ